VSEALVPAPNPRRSYAHYKVQGDPWPVIATWARAHKYLPRDPQTGDTKLFQRGSGFWTAPMKVQFTRVGDDIEVQAWIAIPLISRIGALFLLPAEMNVASGGFRAIIPRNMCRKAVNELLAQVGAAPIS
jgi:hypothetical protein